MNAFRDLRRSVRLGQRELASLLAVPLETLPIEPRPQSRSTIPVGTMRLPRGNHARDREIVSIVREIARRSGGRLLTSTGGAESGGDASNARNVASLARPPRLERETPGYKETVMLRGRFD